MPAMIADGMRNGDVTSMTMDEIKQSKKVWLTPKDVAKVCGCHPYTISLKARDGTLEFPYMRHGNRTKIPRIPFITFIEGSYRD